MARNFSEVASRGRITGDFGKLAGWKKLFETFPEILDAISAAGADALVGRVKDGFRKETDPYGKRWARKKKPDGRKVLSGKTSNLKGGWHYQRTDRGGFTISPGVGYAQYHQTGAPSRNMPARKMVPDSSGGGLPPEWSQDLEETANEIIKAHLSSAGGGSSSGGTMLPWFIKNQITALKRQLNIKALIRKLSNAASDE